MGKINFYGVGLNILDTKEVLNLCEKYFRGNNVKTIFFLNAHYYNLASRDIIFRKQINKSNLMLNDGIGIRLGLKFKGINEKENLNGTDLIPKIIDLASKKNKKVFLLGGQDGVAKNAKEKLQESFDGINIVGYQNGYFTIDQEKAILDTINNSGADLLIVGMGAPYQEAWIDRNKDKLTNVKIIVSGGAILDFISGRVTRAPKWVRTVNMEWAYRLILEPKRLFKRYIIGNIAFFFNIYSNRNVKDSDTNEYK